MKTITLEEATKAEIIEAIGQEFPFPDVRKRIERQVFSIRCHRLLAEMRDACDEMATNCQTGPYDPEKRDRWFKANSRWNRANRALSKLQGV